MNSRLTSQQYRKLAEGLLESAIAATKEQKQDFIRDAIAYLAYARAQDERYPSTEPRDSTELENQEDSEGQYRQVQQLIKQALEVPTPKELENFLEFSRNFRRLSIWNARMAYIQRPGARHQNMNGKRQNVSCCRTRSLLSSCGRFHQYASCMSWKIRDHF